jgi:hypothetical protein
VFGFLRNLRPRLGTAPKPVRRGRIGLGFALCLFPALSLAQTYPTYTDLHDFGGTVVNANGKPGPDCQWPEARVTFDSQGNMYGTGYAGGPNNAANGGDGVLWEITKAGVYKDLHDFGGTVINADGKSGPDGAYPECAVTFDSEGNMYGTTEYGGPNNTSSFGDGMAWEITKTGVYKDIHDFGGTVANADGKAGPDGKNPEEGFTFDSSGNMYCAVVFGGPNNASYGGEGMVCEITKTSVYIDVHDFGGTVLNADGKSGPDGGYPLGVTLDAAANIYGTATYGGPNKTSSSGNGMVWEITKTGVYKDIHDFGGTVANADGKLGPDGTNPEAGVTLDPAGNAYGTTTVGGPNNATNLGDGIAWEITNTGVYKDLHDFGGTVINADGKSGRDGIQPVASVTFDSEGNIYGTANEGGPNSAGDGMVWEITSKGVYKDLHDFGGTIINADGKSGPDGIQPFTSVTFDPSGNLYGTAVYGGPYGQYARDGMVWKLSVVNGPALNTVSVAPTSILGGTASTGTVTLSASAPAGGTVILLSSSSLDATVPGSVTVSAGAKTATFTVKSAPVATNVSAVVTAKLGTVTKTAAITVQAAVLTGFTVAPDTFVGSSTTSVTGTLTLNGPPPSAGATIKLTSSDPTAVSVPATALIHSGNTSVTFPIKHYAVKSNELVTITATYGATTRTFKVEVTA